MAKRKYIQGENVRLIREWLGLSQNDLANILGVDIIALEKLESKKVVSLQIVKKLATALHIERADIMFPDEQNFKAKMPKTRIGDSDTISDNASAKNNIWMFASEQEQKIKSLEQTIDKLEFILYMQQIGRSLTDRPIFKME